MTAEEKIIDAIIAEMNNINYMIDAGDYDVEIEYSKGFTFGLEEALRTMGHTTHFSTELKDDEHNHINWLEVDGVYYDSKHYNTTGHIHHEESTEDWLKCHLLASTII